MDPHAQLGSSYQYSHLVNHSSSTQQQQLLLQSEHPQSESGQPIQHATYAPSTSSLQGLDRIHRNSVEANSRDSFTPPHPSVSTRRGAVDYGALFPSSGLDNTDVPDKYIPSSTDRVTSPDHRPLDDIFASLHSFFRPAPGPSSMQYDQLPAHLYPLQNQNQNSQRHTQHIPPSQQSGHPPSHHHVPQIILRKPQLKPPMSGILHIPLMQVDNQQRGSGLVINFRCWERGLLTDGVSISELLHCQAYALERGLDRVLDGLGRPVKLNIVWPGYPPFVRNISPVLSDGRAITRAELGYQVALAFSAFFCEVGKTQSGHVGPFTIVAVRNGNLSAGIRFDRLRLLGVRETSLGEWTPEVCAVTWLDNEAP
ncbi:hypothetical protein SCLCIDRAFT_1214819 [Scleroderma citrinum Foug A]|uniref:Uncharacterized protein n=1 Tax=Scleroderma citrinum Foug A TaxID=1036808 RepID=A0A0C3ACR1_9AGAM|nr:hypothetical protein SCLCIDRAFT_1214819 [Scleroderma citrinum Foug A]